MQPKPQTNDFPRHSPGDLASSKSKTMSDERQIFIPESFIEIFRTSRHGRLQADRHQIENRYEWCEDMAQMLVEPTRNTFWTLGLDECTVLERTLQGLRGAESGLSLKESAWVTRRLCELLDWPPEVCPSDQAD
jgi:hypothetical protein